MKKIELLNKITRKDAKGEYSLNQWDSESFFLNNKRIKLKELVKVVLNNHPESAVYSKKESIRYKPYFVGDYEYFILAYEKNNILEKKRIYISVSW